MLKHLWVYTVVRLPVLLLKESDTHGQVTLLTTPKLRRGQSIGEHPIQSSINPKDGTVCQPISAAALEEQMVQHNQVHHSPMNPVVYRSLPNGEWIIFNEHTTLAMSANVYNQL